MIKIKNVIPLVLIACVMINSMLAAMEPACSSLQKAQSATHIQPIRGKICILDQAGSGLYFGPVHYPTHFTQKRLNYLGINISPYDPCSPVTLQFDEKEKQKLPLDNGSLLYFLNTPIPIIPVKQLLPLSSGSTLKLNICGKPVELLCTGNPLIDDTTFQEQLMKRLDVFFQDPTEWAYIGKDPEDELIPARIVKKIDEITCAFDINGCPNIFHLAKVILNEKNQKIGQPQQTSLFWHVLNRQTGQKNKNRFYINLQGYS